MSRFPIVLALCACLGAAACQLPAGLPGGPAAGAAASPAAPPRPSPTVLLRPPAQAILTDQVVGSARRAGADHLTAAQLASEQQDQAAALATYSAWGWLDGASRTWATADETLVETARPDGAARAFTAWSADGAGPCPGDAATHLDECRLAVSGDRAVVVGRLAAAVFRLRCPAEDAGRLISAQAATLRS